MSVSECKSVQEEYNAVSKGLVGSAKEAVTVKQKYVSNFPYAWRRKSRFNRELVTEGESGERVMIFSCDSLIIGSSVFKLERDRGTRYLVNQSNWDTIGWADRRWNTLSVEGYGTLIRENKAGRGDIT